jgi:hypothetical protein
MPKKELTGRTKRQECRDRENLEGGRVLPQAFLSVVTTVE